MTVTITCPDPACNGHMVERENRHNATTFMGCSEYPRCTETMPVPAYITQVRAGAARLFDDEITVTVDSSSKTQEVP